DAALRAWPSAAALPRSLLVRVSQWRPMHVGCARSRGDAALRAWPSAAALPRIPSRLALFLPPWRSSRCESAAVARVSRLFRRYFMEGKTAADFHAEVLRWFDKYVHGIADRRGFLNGVAKYAVGGVTASGLLEALSPRFAEAQQVAKDDRRIKAQFVEYSSPE